MATLTKAQKENFASLKATIEGSAEGFIYANNESLTPFVNAGLVDVNEELKDAAGNVAVRLKVAETTQTTAIETAPKAEKAPRATASAFVLEDNIAMPTTRATVAMYPFDEMNVGQSFFVADSEEKPDAAKSLGSTVSSATARYKEDGVVTRKFVVRKVEGGARVWRTQ